MDMFSFPGMVQNIISFLHQGWLELVVCKHVMVGSSSSSSKWSVVAVMVVVVVGSSGSNYLGWT